MEIFREDKGAGISCGVNDLGDLFLGDSRSGYNLKDTPENRHRIIDDFEYWTQKAARRLSIGRRGRA